MTVSTIFMLVIFMTVLAFVTARVRALSLSRQKRLHSLPRYYGYYAAACSLLPGLFVLLLWLLFGSYIIDGIVIESLQQSMQITSDVEAKLALNRVKIVFATGSTLENNPTIIAAADQYAGLLYKGKMAAMVFALGLGLMGIYFANSRITPDFRARNKYEKILLVVLAASSALAVLTTLGIVFSLLFESIQFFEQVPLLDFLTGTHWSPQTSLRDDQVASSGSFGALPLFAGTALVSLIAMLVAVPIGLMSAIYMTQYASKKTRKITKPILEILAGVPTVVYGFFAALTVAPLFRDIGDAVGIPVDSHSALAAGAVMGIMIIPFVSSLSDDALSAVPKSLKEGSLALGATPSETISKVILPAALPGVIGAILLAASRAIGETMIVVMAAGMQANLTADPTQSVTTVTVQIVKLLTGDQEFDSAKTLSAFALGLVLFIATLILNIFAQKTVRKYREAYD